MSSPFEPFTPANGGRRAQEWNWQEEQYQAQDPWAQQQQYQQPQYPQYEQSQYQQSQYQQSQYQQPVYEAYQQPQYQQYQPSQPAYTPPEPRERKSRYKPILFGLVAALVLVSGWQAFRVETIIQSSNDLAEAVSTSQDRVDELEKQRTSAVFDSEGIAEAVLPSVFRVRAGEFTGTAFAVSEANGRTSLFTNFHVVEELWDGGDKAVTLERGDTRINATIVKVDQGKDLALLRANREIKALGIAAGAVKSGQQVLVAGAPLGLEDSVTTGVISAFRNTEDGPTIQFDAPINPGNSGGPVINSSRQVVGIATAKARDAEGIGLAIPIEVACETLGACGNG
jgi:putative serine protease PepD